MSSAVSSSVSCMMNVCVMGHGYWARVLYMDYILSGRRCPESLPGATAYLLSGSRTSGAAILEPTVNPQGS